MIVGAEHGERRGGFSLAVGVHEADFFREDFDRATDDLHRHRRAAVCEVGQRREIGFREGGIVDDLFHHRGNDEGVRDVLARDQIEPCLGVELRHDDELAAGPDVGHVRGGSGDVVERHAHQRDAAIGAVGHLDVGGHVGGEIAEAQLHAFRQRRGPAGVHEDRNVLILDFSFGFVGLGLCDQIGETRQSCGAFAERDDFARAQPGLNLRDQFEIAIADEQRFRIGGVDHVFELGILGAIIQRQEREPGLGGGVVAFDVEVGVGVENCDHVAMREAELFEDRAQARDLVVEIRVGEAALRRRPGFPGRARSMMGSLRS